jgi:hypothetical protein
VKLNILLGDPGGARSGYLNVDPTAPEGCDDGRVRGEPHDLSALVDRAECAEVVAHEVLDYYPAALADGVLDHWLSLLARGGTLSLSAVDAREVARATLSGALTTDQRQELLHGAQREPWQVRKSTYTLAQLTEALSGRGYDVLAARVQDCRAVVTARRPS